MAQTHPVVGIEVPGPGGKLLRLARVLGAGAFGIVFEATGAETTERFAVKFLQTGVLASEHERQALMNEIMAASEVKHGNVLQVVYVSSADHTLSPYIVTEFANGGTLHERLADWRCANKPVPLELLREWSLAICQAMRAINAKVLHRDIKPDNILISDGMLRIADFGLAKLVGNATRTTTFKGGQHLLYMAPEGWEGRRNDIQLDMYSVGLVLYELATLSYPYVLPQDFSDFDAFRRMHLLQAPANPRAARTDLPQRYAEVVLRLLSKRPEERYSSWDEVLEALERSFQPPRAGQTAPALAERLAQLAHSRHEQETRQRLEEEAERRSRGERAQIDAFQQKEILDYLGQLVAAFNGSTEGPRAEINQTGHDDYKIQFPYARPAEIYFFGVSPPLSLQGFGVRYAAHLADADGCGFNLLLRRREGDQYGVWVVCRVRTNPLSSYAHPACKYFGMNPGQMREIETGIRAMHVYIPEISEDYRASIDQFVESLFKPPERY